MASRTPRATERHDEFSFTNTRLLMKSRRQVLSQSGPMHRTASPVWRRSALSVGLSTALCLSLRAGAVGDTGSVGRTLTLSPSSFDAASGLLQLDARLPFAAPQSRMLLAFRCAGASARQEGM